MRALPPIVDIGAYESVDPCTSGDATGDGEVDVDDLNLVLANWENPCDTVEEQQMMMLGELQGPSDEIELPLDLRSLGFTSWAEYREYLLSLSPAESVLHAMDVLEAHNALCGDEE